MPANPLKLNSDVHLVSEKRQLLLLLLLLTPDPLRIPAFQSSPLIVMTTLALVTLFAGLLTILLYRRRARAKDQLHKNQIYMESLAISPVE